MMTATALALVVSFAILCTTHLSLVVALLFRAPGWKAFAALLPPLAPLAPYWGFQTGLKRSAWLWIGALTIYLVSLTAGYIYGK